MLLLAAGALLFLLPNPSGPIVGLAYWVLAFLAFRRGQRVYWFGFGLSTVLLGATLYGLALPGPPTVAFWIFRLGPYGALIGALETLRLLGFFALGALTTRVIDTRDLLPIVSTRPTPLYVAASLVRLVPALRNDYERIRRTQLARGLDPATPWTRPARFLPILVPLFVGTLRRAREQALQLELAGLSEKAAP